jgi:hypothetical protein
MQLSAHKRLPFFTETLIRPLAYRQCRAKPYRFINYRTKRMQQELVTGLDAARVIRIKALLASLKAELDYTVQLTAAERTTLNAVSDGRKPFIEAAAKAAAQYGRDIALDVADQSSLAAASYDFEMMSDIMDIMGSLEEAVSDTTMLLGAICYEKSLIVRELVGLSIRRGKPGMEKVFSDLSHLWEGIARPNGNGKENIGANSNGGPGLPLIPGSPPQA